jgi:acetolactate synthase small subunit
MTDEERQRTMDFILTQQAQFSINIESLREAQARTDETVSRLSVQVEQLTAQVGQIARQQEHMNEVVAVIADAQQHTYERLNALIDIVQGKNGQA